MERDTAFVRLESLALRGKQFQGVLVCCDVFLMAQNKPRKQPNVLNLQVSLATVCMQIILSVHKLPSLTSLAPETSK